MRRAVLILAASLESEKEEGMLIARGAEAVAPRQDFTWNLKAGTARRRQPFRLAGGDLRAQLIESSPLD